MPRSGRRRCRPAPRPRSARAPAARSSGCVPPRPAGTREREQPAVQLAQQLLVDARLVVEALAVAGGHELAEVAVALAVHGEEDQVVVAAGLVVVDPARLL